MSNSSELPEMLVNTTPWNAENQAIWIASSLILRRNLGRYNFPSKLQPSESDQVLDCLKSKLLENAFIENPKFFSIKELSSSDRELLFEHFLFLKGIQEPPNGSGIILDDKGFLLVIINSGNHLEIRSLTLSSQWEEPWNKMGQMENHLSENLGFAFSPKFGYLTSDPSQSGTGLTIHAYLHLPALIHAKQLEGALASTEDDNVTFLGLSGNLQEFIGDLVVIQNHYCIGMNEESIMRCIQTSATKLIGAEKTMRSHLKQEQNTEIKDLITKAFGVIIHSFQIETKEALDLLSVLKLGLALDYISNISDQKLNELFFKCRRGHFLRLFPELKDPKEIAQKRADFLQQQLQGITLSPELQ